MGLTVLHLMLHSKYSASGSVWGSQGCV